jgi:catalase
MTDQRPVTTTDAGIAAPSDEFSQTAGPNGPLLLQDHSLLQKMAQFNRERVPEPVVRAKGGGAYGIFESTEDVSQYTKASLFTKGKTTRLLTRFSTMAGELGGADTVRDPRGFAIKFYTDEGNYDLVGNNTPVFFVRDPQKFSDFIHSQKRRADNNLRDHNMQWDFWTLSPESAHQVTILMSDRGIPASWRHMNGYSSHTFMWYNAGGQKSWVKYHVKTDQGIQTCTDSEARLVAAEDPDAHSRDLHQAITRGDLPSWTVQVQLMPFADAADYRFNPFDLTKVWPHADYPPITIGRITLDKNPDNYFAEIEQAAFEPANLVPGVTASPDKMLQARQFSYPDTHRYRIGTTYLQIPVNQPKAAAVHSYNKDGAMRYANPNDPVYAPNSYGGPTADQDLYTGETYQVAGDIVRSAYTKHRDDGDFVQTRTLVEHVMSDEDRDHLVTNIANHIKSGVHPDTLPRVLDYWRNVSADLGARVAKEINGRSESRR